MNSELSQFIASLFAHCVHFWPFLPFARVLHFGNRATSIAPFFPFHARYIFSLSCLYYFCLSCPCYFWLSCPSSFSFHVRTILEKEKEKDFKSTETGDQESLIQDIQECKQDKRNAKRNMTRLLNKLAATLSEDDQIPKTEIKDMLHKIEEQQDHTIMAINRLESSYQQQYLLTHT